ncbi:MAG: hypothetical protein ABRQ25_12515 [Clostridiaceae bacterium]
MNNLVQELLAKTVSFSHRVPDKDVVRFKQTLREAIEAGGNIMKAFNMKIVNFIHHHQ